MSPPFFVLSGCSGGGKSTLLDAVSEAGYHTVPEPGRRVIAQGGPRPWDDPLGFATAAAQMAEADYDAALDLKGPVIFDRGLVDALAAMARIAQQPFDTARAARRPYAETVFLAPPWPEIFRTDPERRHGFDAAVTEHDHLQIVFTTLGHRLVPLPLQPVAERLDLIQRILTNQTKAP